MDLYVLVIRETTSELKMCNLEHYAICWCRKHQHYSSRSKARSYQLLKLRIANICKIVGI
jgi:hypothetical protein